MVLFDDHPIFDTAILVTFDPPANWIDILVRIRFNHDPAGFEVLWTNCQIYCFKARAFRIVCGWQVGLITPRVQVS